MRGAGPVHGEAGIAAADETLASRREKFGKVRRANGAAVIAAQAQPVVYFPIHRTAPREDTADGVVIGITGGTFKGQHLEEGLVGQDRHPDFAEHFKQVERTGVADRRHLHGGQIVGQRHFVRADGEAVPAIFDTEGCGDHASRQLDQIPGKAAARHCALEGAGRGGVDAKEIGHLRGERIVAEDVDRDVARDDRVAARGRAIGVHNDIKTGGRARARQQILPLTVFIHLLILEETVPAPLVAAYIELAAQAGSGVEAVGGETHGARAKFFKAAAIAANGVGAVTI